MEEKTMTMEDVLLDAVNALDNMAIPVSMIESIGIPIAKIKNNLMACLAAIAEEKKRAAEEQGREKE